MGTGMSLRKWVWVLAVLGTFLFVFAPASEADSRKTQPAKAVLVDADWSPLMKLVATRPDVSAVRRLLREGANASFANSLGMTALHVAVRYGASPECVGLLVGAGASLEARDRGGQTPLVASARYNDDPSMITALVRAGANLESRDNTGMTALIAAAARDCTAVVQALLDARADINARDRVGENALMHACMNASMREPATLGALLGAGAEVDATDSSGLTALMILSATTEYEELVDTLLRGGASVAPRDRYGNTALFHALQRDPGEPANIFVVERLVKAGADVNGRNGRTETPLMVAALNGTRPGDSPMRCSETRCQNGSILKYLISAGARVNDRDAAGRTALAYALFSGDARTLAELRQAGGTE